MRYRWNESYESVFHVALFIILYKVVLTFKSVDEILVCDHSNESYWAVLSCGTVYYAVQRGSNFILHVWPSNESYSVLYWFLNRIGWNYH